MLNKKAQVGETMTWVVATIVILIILLVSIYASITLAKSRETDYYSDSFFSKDYSRNNDLVMEKSLFTYFLIPDNDKKEVLENLLQMNENKEFHINFNLKFEELKGDFG